MLAKQHDPFISLMQPHEGPMMAPAPAGETSGPTLYVHGVHLPVTEEDIGTVLTAEVKLKPTRVSVTKENGQTHESFDLEVQAIHFTG